MSVEDIIKCMALQLRPGEVVYVGLASVLPIISIRLAQSWGISVEFVGVSEIYDPIDVSVTESTADPFSLRGGRGIIGSLELFDLARRGKLDVMFFGPAQVDRRANINLSVIGSFDKPRVRLPGGAAAAFLYRRARRVIMWLMEHSRRTLVDKVDFVTAPGPSGKEGPREIVLCTPRAVFRFDHDEGELVLTGLMPQVSLEEAIEAMGFTPRVKESLEEPPQATQEDLAIIEKVDPRGLRYGRRTTA
jgi:glutaconate CoA-transferase subunit B